MSTGAQPMSLREGRIVANSIIERLKPFCNRIEVAGSIRRAKAWVNDVEIVLIPKTTQVQVLVTEATMFDPAVFKTAWSRDPGYGAAVREMASSIVRGYHVDTAKWTQILTHQGHKVDLFTAVPDNWGYIFLIRTGSAEYSQAILGAGNKKGFKGVDGMWTRYGTPYPVREEADMFAALNIKPTDPRSRG